MLCSWAIRHLAWVAGGIIAHGCFCFGSEAMNASGEAMRGLVKSGVCCSLTNSLRASPTREYCGSSCHHSPAHTCTSLLQLCRLLVQHPKHPWGVNTPSRFMLLKPEIRSGLMSHWAHKLYADLTFLPLLIVLKLLCT